VGVGSEVMGLLIMYVRMYVGRWVGGWVYSAEKYRGAVRLPSSEVALFLSIAAACQERSSTAA